jgi:hypothetical protein
LGDFRKWFTLGLGHLIPPVDRVFRAMRTSTAFPWPNLYCSTEEALYG